MYLNSGYSDIMSPLEFILKITNSKYLDWAKQANTVVNKQKHGDLILCSIPPIVYDAIRLHDTIEAYRVNMTLLEFLEKVLGPNK